MVFTSACHYFYPVSHFETANGIHYLQFKAYDIDVADLKYEMQLVTSICLNSASPCITTLIRRRLF